MSMTIESYHSISIDLDKPLKQKRAVMDYGSVKCVILHSLQMLLKLDVKLCSIFKCSCCTLHSTIDKEVHFINDNNINKYKDYCGSHVIRYKQRRYHL